MIPSLSLTCDIHISQWVVLDRSRSSHIYLVLTLSTKFPTLYFYLFAQKNYVLMEGCYVLNCGSVSGFLYDDYRRSYREPSTSFSCRV